MSSHLKDAGTCNEAKMVRHGLTFLCAGWTTDFDTRIFIEGRNQTGFQAKHRAGLCGDTGSLDMQITAH